MFPSVLERDIRELMCCGAIDHSPLTESFLLFKLLLVMCATVKFKNFFGRAYGRSSRYQDYQLGRPGQWQVFLSVAPARAVKLLYGFAFLLLNFE